MSSKGNAGRRSRSKTPRLQWGRPRSGDDVRLAFAEHPHHAARMLMPETIRYEFVEVATSLLIACLVPVVLVLGVRIFALGQYFIPSPSMENTLAVGDRVITTQNLTLNTGDLKRGDIIVFHDPDRWLDSDREKVKTNDDFLIKRLIGLPGDKVRCDGNGKPVMINGQAVDESAYLKKGVEPSSFPFEVHVPAGHVFVLGDNRSNSSDSRYHLNDSQGGMVPIDNITGVALRTCWPFSHWKRLNNHHDVFDAVPDIDNNQYSSSSGSQGYQR
ncbi:signal peptidase I [Bombiscardovia apis]|uniref:Signal peptidase I n=1 Tax=Bombiscardovia apis TaxID=2932182 RepID=A0ABM8BBC9_9BIFI|nr:signal peptidase I [Bombiscardovia apis]BDR54227.1 signal peptidase I [Bombiscardovia apis]